MKVQVKMHALRMDCDPIGQTTSRIGQGNTVTTLNTSVKLQNYFGGTTWVSDVRIAVISACTAVNPQIGQVVS